MQEKNSTSSILPNIEAMEKALQPSPAGIKGWLLLVAFIVIASPIRIAIESFQNFYITLIEENLWEPLTNPMSEYYIPYFKSIAILELGVNILLILAWLYIGFLFFTKKRLFKKSFILLLVITPVVIILDATIAGTVLNINIFDQDTIKSIIQSVFAAIIWSAYIKKSKRVMNTFIH